MEPAAVPKSLDRGEAGDGKTHQQLDSCSDQVDVHQLGWKTDPMDDRCPFCDIVSGRAHARIVSEWEAGIAFFPLKPATPGHLLVVPRRHVQDIWSADEVLGADLLRHIVRLARLLKVALSPDGMNIINSTGDVASQTVRCICMSIWCLGIAAILWDRYGPMRVVFLRLRLTRHSRRFARSSPRKQVHSRESESGEYERTVEYY